MASFVLKFISYCLFVSLFLTFYCEFAHYYLVLYQCNWPKTERSEQFEPNSKKPLKIMALADTHLLGKRHGHWFDKLRREWQMYRAYQSSIFLHQPDVVVFLGDLFDEGKWCPPHEFRDYVSRFSQLFHVPSKVQVLIAAGNHDMGFHYSLNPHLVSRFEEAFASPAVQTVQIAGVTLIVINSMAMEGDDCFLCKPARQKIKTISKQLQCAKGDKELCKHFNNTQFVQYSKPIVLQHYPLFRDSDSKCDEPDEAPELEKFRDFKPNWDCLSVDATNMILSELKPRLILSGHTHHGCHIQHHLPDSSFVDEFTVASFSWRNKQNPTFLMLTVTADNYSVSKCHMPQENTVIALYGVGIIIVVCATLWSLLRWVTCSNASKGRYKD